MKLLRRRRKRSPKVEDMVVDPDQCERERSVSASATTRLPLSSRTGARIELRSNQAVRLDTPAQNMAGIQRGTGQEPT